MEQHYWAVAALAIFHACLLIVAIISFIAGVDLWRLRMRGRKLAVTTMILIFPVTVLYLAAAPAQHLAQRFVARFVFFCSASSLFYTCSCCALREVLRQALVRLPHKNIFVALNEETRVHSQLPVRSRHLGTRPAIFVGEREKREAHEHERTHQRSAANFVDHCGL
jgi:hypothetical protein